MKASAPNIANPAVKLIAELTENTGLRNSRSGSTGSAARRANHHQPTASSTAATPRPTMTGEPQAYWVPPHEVSSTTQVAAPASSSVPR
jgi:hypothetical protein